MGFENDVFAKREIESRLRCPACRSYECANDCRLGAINRRIDSELTRHDSRAAARLNGVPAAAPVTVLALCLLLAGCGTEPKQGDCGYRPLICHECDLLPFRPVPDLADLDPVGPTANVVCEANGWGIAVLPSGGFLHVATVFDLDGDGDVDLEDVAGVQRKAAQAGSITSAN